MNVDTAIKIIMCLVVGIITILMIAIVVKDNKKWYKVSEVLIVGLIAAIIILVLPMMIIVAIDIKESTIIHPEYIVRDNNEHKIDEIYLSNEDRILVFSNSSLLNECGTTYEYVDWVDEPELHTITQKCMFEYIIFDVVLFPKEMKSIIEEGKNQNSLAQKLQHSIKIYEK